MNTQDIGKAYICAFAPQLGTIRLEGPVDTHSSHALCQSLEILRKDYCYDEARLEIESAGGELTAMRQMLRAIQHAKAQGVLIQTHTHTRAASAAAVLLSSGSMGHRSVNPEAQLLYHHSRLMTPKGMPLTAEMAGSAQEQIDRFDRWLLESLQTELCRGTGGQEALVSLVVDRSQRMLARYDELISDLYVVFPSAAQQRSEKQTLRQLADLHTKPADSALKAYGVLLRKIFDRDRPINQVLAYALCLIDHVEHFDLELDVRGEAAGSQDQRSDKSAENTQRQQHPQCRG